jgi:hypothetical protein
MNNKFNVGDVIFIRVTRDKFPGVKQLKKGNYKVTEFRRGFFMGKDMVYGLQSMRKGSTYQHFLLQQWVEENSELIK